jgi:toxin ParE1/3/4
MTRRVVIRAEARQDLRAARDWYRDISRGLGADFVKRVNDAVVASSERPAAFPVVLRTFRRVLVRRFPYALFFHADQDRIVVVAVLHQARSPNALARRRT